MPLWLEPKKRTDHVSSQRQKYKETENWRDRGERRDHGTVWTCIGFPLTTLHDAMRLAKERVPLLLQCDMKWPVSLKIKLFVGVDAQLVSFC